MKKIVITLSFVAFSKCVASACPEITENDLLRFKSTESSIEFEGGYNGSLLKHHPITLEFKEVLIQKESEGKTFFGRHLCNYKVIDANSSAPISMIFLYKD